MMNTKTNAGSLQTKDYIMLGIFSLLFSIILFIMAGMLGIFPMGFLLFGLVGSIPCGIIFMYILTKIPKRGTVFILGFISALFDFFVGAYIITALFVVLAGFLGEIIISQGKYKNFASIAVGYVVFMVTIWFGFMYPMLFEPQQYIASYEGKSLGGEYMVKLIEYINSDLFYIFLFATILGATIGIFLGKKMFNKHFAKINS